MKIFILTILSFGCLNVNAQLKKGKSIEHRFTESEKYFSFNPFALAELQIAIGAGFGNRFSERSEYFAELSYIAKHPFYDMPEKSLHGFRFLAQYRYHFLQRGRPLINLGNFTKRNKERNSRRNPFIGVEFRLKPFNFSATNTFISTNPADTLNKFLYNANAVSVGGAILFGETYNISANGKWKIEITFGIGGKNKFVKFKNVPNGYQLPQVEPVEWNFIPEIYESIAMPYFPGTIRLRYHFN